MRKALVVVASIAAALTLLTGCYALVDLLALEHHGIGFAPQQQHRFFHGEPLAPALRQARMQFPAPPAQETRHGTQGVARSEAAQRL